MQNINHGKYINYLKLWRNSEIDAASVLKAQCTEGGKTEKGEKENSLPEDLNRLYDVLGKKKDEDVKRCVCECVSCACLMDGAIPSGLVWTAPDSLPLMKSVQQMKEQEIKYM